MFSRSVFYLIFCKYLNLKKERLTPVVNELIQVALESGLINKEDLEKFDEGATESVPREETPPIIEILVIEALKIAKGDVEKIKD